MYTLESTLRFVSGEWEYVSINDWPIDKLLENNAFNLITLTNSYNEYFLITNSELVTIEDKQLSFSVAINNYTKTLPKLLAEVELSSSSYKDILKPVRIGDDYIIEDNIPFLISKAGLFPVSKKVVSGIHSRLETLENFNIGYFNVELPFTIHRFNKTELSRTLFKLERKFKLNNTLVVFGDSLIKASKIFIDDGESYRLNSSYNKWLVDLYTENLTTISPNTLGLNVHSLTKIELSQSLVLAKLFSHYNVYFIEYNLDYPIGECYIEVVNESIDDHYTDLIMYGNKPSTEKVLHLRDKYIVRNSITKEYSKNHDDNRKITLFSNEGKIVSKPATLYTLDWPIVKFIG